MEQSWLSADNSVSTSLWNGHVPSATVRQLRQQLGNDADATVFRLADGADTVRSDADGSDENGPDHSEFVQRPAARSASVLVAARKNNDGPQVSEFRPVIRQTVCSISVAIVWYTSSASG